MSLAQVLYPSPTPTGMDEWAFHHARHHDAVVDAVRQTHGINIPTTNPIWPINYSSFDTWLEAHQEMHNSVNAIYGSIGNNLIDVDWKNQNQLQGWFWLNFNEHRNWAKRSGLPI